MHGRGCDRRPSLKETELDPIRYAVVGCGGIANNYHLPGLTGIEGGEFVVACDLVEERAREAADKFGAGGWCADYREVVGRDDLDLVCVFTKIEGHAEISVAAAEGGKHVFVQKPFARTLREGRRMVAAAEASGVQMLTSFMHSYFDESLAAAEWVRSGRIGRVEFMRMRNATGNPRETVASYGGAMMDIGAHGMALLRMVSGEDVARLVARIDEDEPAGPPIPDPSVPDEDRPLWGGEANAWLLYELTSGVAVSHEVQWAARGGTSRFQLEIYGTEGSILVRVPRTGEDLAVAFLDGEPGGESRSFKWVVPELPGTPPGHAHHRAVFEAVRRGSAGCPGEEGMAALRICEAARRSAAAGAWVDVAPA